MGAIFVDTQPDVAICTTIEEMGHPQLVTPVECNNISATGILGATVRQHQSRAIGMRLYWVRDHICQGHFILYWKPGPGKLSNWFTQNRPTHHHGKKRPTFFQRKAQAKNYTFQTSNQVLRGCVTLPGTWHGNPILSGAPTKIQISPDSYIANIVIVSWQQSLPINLLTKLPIILLTNLLAWIFTYTMSL